MLTTETLIAEKPKKEEKAAVATRVTATTTSS